jgi:hypothetical protein
MRFMMIVKANKDTEAGVMPEEKLIAAMTRYNEELTKAGVLIDLAGLQPSSKGASIKFSPGSEAHCGRRTFHRDQRHDRRLLADPSQIERRSA